MRRLACVVAIGAALAGLGPAPVRGAVPGASPLAFGLLAPGETPDLILAQRSIDREWSTPSDSTWKPELLGGVSEPGAMLMSGVLPGAGQLYIGEKSGYVYLLAEAIGWAGWVFLHRGADDDRENAAVVAGAPDDTTAGWTFERWEEATQGDDSAIRQLYAADREAYYDTINHDSRYAAGWNNDATHGTFGDLRERSDQRLEDARKMGTALWINHLVSAFDALHAARQHNLPLNRALELKATGGWSHGGPQMTLKLQRKF